MINKLKKIKIVGEFIKRKRIEHNLSQKELGSLLQPIVTTQFISNIERGITPLPLSHIPALAKNLNIIESEILSLLEKEYVLKLSGKLNQSWKDRVTF